MKTFVLIEGLLHLAPVPVAVGFTLAHLLLCLAKAFTQPLTSNNLGTQGNQRQSNSNTFC